MLCWEKHQTGFLGKSCARASQKTRNKVATREDGIGREACRKPTFNSQVGWFTWKCSWIVWTCTCLPSPPAAATGSHIVVWVWARPKDRRHDNILRSSSLQNKCLNFQCRKFQKQKHSFQNWFWLTACLWALRCHEPANQNGSDSAESQDLGPQHILENCGKSDSTNCHNNLNPLAEWLWDACLLQNKCPVFWCPKLQKKQFFQNWFWLAACLWALRCHEPANQNGSDSAELQDLGPQHILASLIQQKCHNDLNPLAEWLWDACLLQNKCPVFWCPKLQKKQFFQNWFWLAACLWALRCHEPANQNGSDSAELQDLGPQHILASLIQQKCHNDLNPLAEWLWDACLLQNKRPVFWCPKLQKKKNNPSKTDFEWMHVSEHSAAMTASQFGEGSDPAESQDLGPQHILENCGKSGFSKMSQWLEPPGWMTLGRLPHSALHDQPLRSTNSNDNHILFVCEPDGCPRLNHPTHWVSEAAICDTVTLTTTETGLILNKVGASSVERCLSPKRPISSALTLHSSQQTCTWLKTAWPVLWAAQARSGRASVFLYKILKQSWRIAIIL